MCGEKQHSYYTTMLARGSPPHVRGKAAMHGCTRITAGITPAYAGKSRNLLSFFTNAPGSPPRMRGKAMICYSFQQVVGITPAYAGKRKSKRKSAEFYKDHPRVCGEKTKKIP